MAFSTDETDRPVRTRREFFTNSFHMASLAAFGATLGSFLSACASSPTSPSNAASLPVVNGSVSNGIVTVSVDSSSPLNSVGGAALVQYSTGALLVARTSQNAFTALSSTCTHQTCTITGFGNNLYVCPCHGSQFSTSGQVVMGPAAAPLHQFTTSFSNNVLTIS